LRIYLEAYRLSSAEPGRHPFAVRFQVRPVDQDAAPVEGEAPVSLTLDLESPSPTVRRTFDLELGELPLGRYLLQVSVRDPVSGQERIRKARFEVVGRAG
ncbi:MAG: hypothetical protein KY453_03385, partial [Gemmatimonadetes bacterium]|nr:hypothetical protein [Gemmatimonadota bacterium]